MDSLFVGYRQGARQTETDGAGMAIGRITIDILTAAEHLRLSGELGVDFQSDDRFPLVEDCVEIVHRVGEFSKAMGGMEFHIFAKTKNLIRHFCRMRSVVERLP